MFVVDGRRAGYGLGAKVAYNLDGGGSATMFFNGSVANKPHGNGNERAITDVLSIGR